MATTENLVITLLGKPYIENGMIVGSVKRVIVNSVTTAMTAEVERLSEPIDPEKRKLDTSLCATERLFSSVTFI